ncbi:MAG: hypothetical protein JWO62_2681, partial [Acidimicrobiaceae bacterium]|nr:hypothetical protein [Acidimicrobiaceae bacterium]
GSHVVARGSSHVVARGSSHVVARGSSHVVARGSSHVVARESSHVEAWGSSHVEAWGSSHVVARESSHVVARESSHVEARESSQTQLFGGATSEAKGAFCVTTVHGKRAQAIGGVIVAVPDIDTPELFIEWFGIETKKVRGKLVAYLYKAVNDQYNSGYGANYSPGTTLEAMDWDGGKNKCGGGLHLSPSPRHAQRYASEATKFLRCPVLVSEIGVIHEDGVSDKVKVKRVIAPGCVEVDVDGNAVTA